MADVYFTNRQTFKQSALLITNPVKILGTLFTNPILTTCIYLTLIPLIITQNYALAMGALQKESPVYGRKTKVTFLFAQAFFESLACLCIAGLSAMSALGLFTLASTPMLILKVASTGSFIFARLFGSVLLQARGPLKGWTQFKQAIGTLAQQKKLKATLLALLRGKDMLSYSTKITLWSVSFTTIMLLYFTFGTSIAGLAFLSWPVVLPVFAALTIGALIGFVVHNKPTDTDDTIAAYLLSHGIHPDQLAHIQRFISYSVNFLLSAISCACFVAISVGAVPAAILLNPVLILTAIASTVVFTLQRVKALTQSMDDFHRTHQELENAQELFSRDAIVPSEDITQQAQTWIDALSFQSKYHIEIPPEQSRRAFFGRLIPSIAAYMHALDKNGSGQHYQYINTLGEMLRTCYRDAPQSLFIFLEQHADLHPMLEAQLRHCCLSMTRQKHAELIAQREAFTWRDAAFARISNQPRKEKLSRLIDHYQEIINELESMPPPSQKQASIIQAIQAMAKQDEFHQGAELLQLCELIAAIRHEDDLPILLSSAAEARTHKNTQGVFMFTHEQCDRLQALCKEHFDSSTPAEPADNPKAFSSALRTNTLEYLNQLYNTMMENKNPRDELLGKLALLRKRVSLCQSDNQITERLNCFAEEMKRFRSQQAKSLDKEVRQLIRQSITPRKLDAENKRAQGFFRPPRHGRQK